MLEQAVAGNPMMTSAFDVDQLLRKVRDSGHGKSTGWDAVDKLGIRFYPAEFSIVGARTAHGKTTCLLAMALSWLDIYPEETFVLYSYEIPPEAIMMKLLSSLTRRLGGKGWTFYDIRDYVQGVERDGGYPDLNELEAALDTLREWEHRFVTVYNPELSIDGLTDHARRVVETTGVPGAILVDYLQLVPGRDEDARLDRDLQVSKVARRLKQLSVELSCPVVAAAQLSREMLKEARALPHGKPFEDRYVQEAIQERRPQLHHIKEGGCEQEADLVLGLLNYRADYVEEYSGDPRERGKPGRFEVIALKNRYGQTGVANLVFEARTGTIRDALLFAKE